MAAWRRGGPPARAAGPRAARRTAARKAAQKSAGNPFSAECCSRDEALELGCVAPHGDGQHVEVGCARATGEGDPQPTRFLAKMQLPRRRPRLVHPPPSPPSIDAEENNHDHGAADEYTPRAPLAQAPSSEQHELLRQPREHRRHCSSDLCGGRPRRMTISASAPSASLSSRAMSGAVPMAL